MKNRNVDHAYKKLTDIPAGDYEDCTFTNCMLADADLTGVLFADCTFKECDLSNAKLADTAFQKVTFENCKLLGLHFNDCREFLFRVRFNDCNLEFAVFHEVKLKGTNFKDCRLKETDFVGADLREATFNGCNLNRALFERTDLRGADFRNARRFSFSPEENLLKGTRFSIEGLPGLLAEYGIRID